MALKVTTREALVAPPGHVICGVDYDSFELGTWAQACIWMLGYSDMADVQNDERRCAHVEMGTTAYSKDAKGSWEERYAWGYALKRSKDPLIKDVRALGKVANFGLPGGLGAGSMVDYAWDSYGVALSEEKSKDLVASWRKNYREAGPYLETIKKMLASRERGARMTVRQHVSGRVRGMVGFCDGANGFFQGLAGDAATAAGVALAQAAYGDPSSPLFGARQLAFVHDEYLYAIPVRSAAQVHVAAYEMARIMRETAQAFTPDVRISCSPALSFRWSKAAGDPVYGSDGRLLPYELSQGYQGVGVPESLKRTAETWT